MNIRLRFRLQNSNPTGCAFCRTEIVAIGYSSGRKRTHLVIGEIFFPTLMRPGGNAGGLPHPAGYS